MRKRLLRYSLLLLTMLVGVVTSAMAETVTLQYTGSTTTNMSGKNDVHYWLDDRMACEGDKGQNNNFPGLNQDGSIRLYWANGGSNTLTVTSLTGATIDNITIYYVANYTKGYVEVGGQKVDGTELVSVSNAYNYSINSSSFVLAITIRLVLRCASQKLRLAIRQAPATLSQYLSSVVKHHSAMRQR